MRITCITPMYPEPGNARFGSFVAETNRALEAAGAEVSVLRRKPGARGVLSYADLGLRGVASLRALRRADLIHAHYAGVAAAEAALLARVVSRPLVVTFHGSDVESAARLPGRLGVGSIVAAAAGLHFVSEPLRARAREVLAPLGRLPLGLAAGLLDKPTLVQPTGVDLRRFARVPPLNTAREQQPLALLAVGLLVARKGWLDILDALALLRGRGVAARLTAVGDGDREWLRSAAETRAVEGYVDIVGVVPPAELPDTYAAADIVVVASQREGFGLVGLEAMAARRPLVTTSVGGLADYVVAEDNALVVPPQSGAAIADAVQRLMADPALAARVMRGGTTTAARFDSDALGRRLLAFFRELAPTAA